MLYGYNSDKYNQIYQNLVHHSFMDIYKTQNVMKSLIIILYNLFYKIQIK